MESSTPASGAAVTRLVLPRYELRWRKPATP